MSSFGVGRLGAGFGRLGAVGATLGPLSVATNSLVLASASSQFLSATGKTNINQQKFTLAGWVKTTAAVVTFITDFSDGTTANFVALNLNAAGLLTLQATTANVLVANLVTTVAINDGNWHHVAVACDTTQATVNNRCILYIDGAIASLGTNTQPTQNLNLSNNFAATYDIGSRNGTSRFFNGKLAQLYYIDGQQLTPSSFITGTPGVPKTYSGTYTGVFDFFLPFSNSGSLGADGSGEGNNWSPQNSPTQSTDHP